MPIKCPICEEPHTLKQCRHPKRNQRIEIMWFRFKVVYREYTEQLNAGDFKVHLYESFVKELYALVSEEKLCDLRILADFILPFSSGIYIQKKTVVIKRILIFCISKILIRHQKALIRQDVMIAMLENHLSNLINSLVERCEMIYTIESASFIRTTEGRFEVFVCTETPMTETCPICLDGVSSVRTGCGHEFCSVCLLNNIIHAANNATNCPICRASLMKIGFSSKEVMDVCLLLNQKFTLRSPAVVI